jgi:hypothetical protein
MRGRIGMDASSYVDIFATKGVEYLLVLGYLALFIIFIRFLGSPTSRRDKTAGGKKHVH